MTGPKGPLLLVEPRLAQGPLQTGLVQRLPLQGAVLAFRAFWGAQARRLP